MKIYKNIIRKFLFKFQPETAHKITFTLLKLPLANLGLKLFYSFKSDKLEFNRNNFSVSNRIGLAAGLDKDAEVVKQLTSIGFGFIEVGTVTPLPQPGNPTPRLFRLPKNNALINRMGFNNNGIVEMQKKLRKNKSSATIGINLGKNKATPLDEAYTDYTKGFNQLYEYGDYFVINVSSPNTPNLRELQEKSFLDKILFEVQRENIQKTKFKPVFLKIAPDLTFSQIDEIIELVIKHKLAGIIATNTTIERKKLNYSETHINNIGAGGLSGKPMKQKSTEIIKYIKSKTGEKLIIIGVGGISSCKDAIEKLKAGADVIQIYTSFIYEGPAIVKRIKKCLLANNNQ